MGSMSSMGCVIVTLATNLILAFFSKTVEKAKQATVETIVNRYALTRFYFRLTIIEESVKLSAVE